LIRTTDHSQQKKKEPADKTYVQYMYSVDTNTKK